MNKEILRFCLERGFLVDSDLLKLFSETFDVESVKIIIEKVKTYTHQKVLTREVFEKNKKLLHNVFLDLPDDKKKEFEKLKIKLGLSIEISKEKDVSKKGFSLTQNEEDFSSQGIKIISTPVKTKEKVEVADFTNYFRNRFNEMKGILQAHPKLDNLVSIDKIFGNRQGVSVIGIVYDKIITKNKNIILDVEDMTGRIKILINNSKKELYETAEDICLDSVLGFKCSGNNEILFANEIVFPEASILKRKKSVVEEYALFIGDLHFGSKRFLKKGFSKFIDYLNGKTPDTLEVKKIKYLFLVGDVITGVGNYPNQEPDLEIVDLEEQFIGLAELLKQIPKRIKILICPGNHDGVRLMEPQPILDERYAWALQELDNVILVENPNIVNIGARKNFPGFNILSYHGFSYPYYANNISSLVLKKTMNCPEEIAKYLLKNRHLAPTHGSTQYYPNEEDKLLIKEIPDIFVSGHTHKCGISYYNNILVISVSCWEAMTPYQEKFGNEPDHCKVPIFNLKTRAIKILDFEDKEEIEESNKCIIESNESLKKTEFENNNGK